MSDKDFDLAMKKIICAIKEKGYNPVDQINGYLKQAIYILQKTSILLL